MIGRLPEVRPEDASPGVLAIYGDIARSTGIPQVNLIFRHLALDPAVLEWCWSAIAPLYQGGRIASAVARLNAGLSVPRETPVWETAGGEDAEAIRGLLAVYDRGNSWNLLGLGTLLHIADGAARDQTQHSAKAARDGAGQNMPDDRSGPSSLSLPEVPPLPRPGAVPPDLLALVADLSERQGTAELGVQPSLWLHLTLWPAALRRAHQIARPLLDSPEWPGLVEALRSKAEAISAELAARAEPPSSPPPAAIGGYLQTVRHFVDLPIPQMVLFGRVLAGGTPASAERQ